LKLFDRVAVGSPSLSIAVGSATDCGGWWVLVGAVCFARDRSSADLLELAAAGPLAIPLAAT